MNETAYNREKLTGLFLSLIFAVPMGWLYQTLTDAPLLSCMVGNFLVLAALFTIVSDCRGSEVGWVFAIFIVKYILTVYQAYYKSLPLGGEDWGNFNNSGRELITAYNSAFDILIKSNNDLFSRFVGAIYFIFGPHTRQINLYVFASSLVAARYLYRTCMAVTDGDYRASVRTMLIFLIWPIDIIYSVTFLREMPIQMCVIVSFCCFVEYMESRSIYKLIVSAVMISIACMMHSGVVAVLLLYILFFRLRSGDRPSRVFNVNNLIVVGVLIAIFVISPVWGQVTSKLGNIDSAEDLVARAQQFTEGEANTRYVSEMPADILGFILQLPYRTILFAFVPLPWMVYDFETVISLLFDAIPQIWLIWRLVKTLRMTRGNRKLRFYTILGILCVLGTYIVCGMGTTAYGNAIRHRTKILPVLFAVAFGIHDHIKNGGIEYDQRNSAGV